MMITSATAFADYFASVRRRTLTYARAVPPDQLDWAPREGEFSCGDILRHLIAAEAMFVGVAATGIWRYQGHTAHDGDTLAGLLAKLARSAIARLEQGHAEALATLRVMPDAALQEQRPSLDGPSLRAWRWLMVLVEHEIHHRSQLAMYLTLLGVTPPHIFGLGVEDVIARATG